MSPITSNKITKITTAFGNYKWPSFTNLKKSSSPMPSDFKWTFLFKWWISLNMLVVINKEVTLFVVQPAISLNNKCEGI